MVQFKLYVHVPPVITEHLKMFILSRRSLSEQQKCVTPLLMFLSYHSHVLNHQYIGTIVPLLFKKSQVILEKSIGTIAAQSLAAVFIIILVFTLPRPLPCIYKPSPRNWFLESKHRGRSPRCFEGKRTGPRAGFSAKPSTPWWKPIIACSFIATQPLLSSNY